jgi:hypothetical protein
VDEEDWNNVLIILAIIAIVIVISIAITYWQWTLSGLVITAVVGGPILYYCRKKRKEERIAKEKREKAERDRLEIRLQQKREEREKEKEKEKERERINAEIWRDEKISLAEQKLSELGQWLTPVLVIDSNIWMNEKYDSFFDSMERACALKQFKIELFGVQFDEISNIKRSSPFGESKNIRARIAINRIEHLQKCNLLRVVPISIDAKKGAYADPLIVKVLSQQLQQGKNCTFFSDDKELRVRVRQHLSDLSDVNWQILEIEDWIDVCNVIEEGMKLRAERAENKPASIPLDWSDASSVSSFLRTLQ